MAQVNTWNLFSSWALDVLIERTAFEQFKSNNYFMQLWTQRTLPNWTNSYKFNRVDAWTLANAWAITEWVVPTDTAFSMNQVEATMTQLWGFTKFSEIALTDSPTDALMDAWRELWRLIANKADTNIQTVLAASIASTSNEIVVWAWTVWAITSSDVITSLQFADVFAKLKANDAPSYDWNWYVAVLHPYVINDLFKDVKAWSFIELTKYTSPEKAFKWEIWKLFWVRIIESSNVTINVDWWDTTTDVFPTYVMWANAYWVVTSQNMSMKVKMPWSAWTADPLDQIWTVWWKLRFGATAIKEESLYAIQSAASLWAN